MGKPCEAIFAASVKYSKAVGSHERAARPSAALMDKLLVQTLEASYLSNPHWQHSTQK